MIHRTLFCSDFPEAHPCCSSCHEDEAGGFDNNLWMEEYLHVCCAKQRWLNEQGARTEDYAALAAIAGKR